MKESRRINAFSITIILIATYLGLIGSLELSATSLATVEAASLSVYWDENCTRKVDLIDWGSLSPGSSEIVNVYLRNERNARIRLSLTTTDSEPPQAFGHISLSWNYTGEMMKPNDVVPIAFDLSLSPYASEVTTFSFSIVISSEETSPSLLDFDKLFAINKVKMILPSNKAPKPLKRWPAKVSDWLASAFVYTKLLNVTEGLDTG